MLYSLHGGQHKERTKQTGKRTEIRYKKKGKQKLRHYWALPRDKTCWRALW